MKEVLRSNLPDDFIILPTPLGTYIVISSESEFKNYKARRISKLYYYEKIFKYTKFRYFKPLNKQLKKSIVNRIEENKSINDLISFTSLKCKNNGVLISPSCYRIKDQVFVVLDQNELEQYYHPDQGLVEITPREYFDFIYSNGNLEMNKAIDAKKRTLKQKYIEFNKVQYPIPFKLWKAGPELLRGYFGHIGLQNSNVEETEFGFRYFD